MIQIVRPLVVASLVLAAACSSSEGATLPTPPPTAPSAADVEGGANDGRDAGVAIPSSARPPAPEVLSAGGPVMKAPRIVPVFFPDDPLESRLVTFVDALPTLKFYGATVSEYGVGPATVSAPVVLAEAAPAHTTDKGIDAWLAAKIAAAAPGFASADDETLFLIFYPETSAVEYAGLASCVQFAGFHKSVVSGTKDIPYAMIGRCPAHDGLSAFDVVTTSVSHEVVESLTDPHPDTKPAFGTLDARHAGWALLGLEVSDLCFVSSTLNGPVRESGYALQTAWSNDRARNGGDPCVPSAAPVYFNAAPIFTETVDFKSPWADAAVPTEGVKIAVGASKTLDVALFSDGDPRAPWTLEAIDLTPTLFGDFPSLALSLDRTKASSGDTVHLTITPLARTSIGSSPFLLVSHLGDRAHFWFGLVVN